MANTLRWHLVGSISMEAWLQTGASRKRLEALIWDRFFDRAPSAVIAAALMTATKRERNGRLEFLYATAEATDAR